MEFSEALESGRNWQSVLKMKFPFMQCVVLLLVCFTLLTRAFQASNEEISNSLKSFRILDIPCITWNADGTIQDSRHYAIFLLENLSTITSGFHGKQRKELLVF